MNTNNYVNLSKCPACGSSSFEQHYVSGGEDYVISSCCRTCGLALPEGDINEIRDWWRKINILAAPRDKMGRKTQKGDWVSNGKDSYQIDNLLCNVSEGSWFFKPVYSIEVGRYEVFPIKDFSVCPKDKEGAPILIGSLVYLWYDRNSLYRVKGYDKDGRVKVAKASSKGKDIRYVLGELLTHQPPAYLRSCPFCGGEPHLSQSSTPNTWFVRCEQCQVSMRAGESPEEAAEAWNNRKGEK